jgi:hypothetical protein
MMTNQKSQKSWNQCWVGHQKQEQTPPPHSYKDMMLKAHNHGSQT